MAVARMGLGRRVLYGVIVVVAIFATLFGLSNGRIFGFTPAPSPTPIGTIPETNPVDIQPAPSLFKATDLVLVSPLLAPQLERAETALDDFYEDQPAGSAVDDRAFVTWASKQVSEEPSATERSRELTQVADINPSNKSTLAARWLSVHGCRDVWTSYVLEQQRFHPDDDQVATRTELDAVLNLATRVTSSTQRNLANRSRGATQSPCAPRNTLNPADCSCSFPSAAAAVSAAARTYLSALGPISSRQYAWMEQQVGFAAVYQGFELPSDVEAGAFLGYLVGKYFVESHGYANLGPEPTATPN